LSDENSISSIIGFVLELTMALIEGKFNTL
jgi:hypothetical protein